MAKRSKHKKLIPAKYQVIGSAIIIVVLALVIFSAMFFRNQLKPVSANTKASVVTIKSGDSVRQIADALKQAGLIRSAWAMEVYVDTMNYSNSLQAGTYALSPNESTETIVRTLVSGDIQTNLVTILPGKRLDQIRDSLINYGYSPAVVANALNYSNYSNLPIASLIQNPPSMEGLLWPDSFARQSTTPLTTLISESLNEMYNHLTPAVQSAFASEGLTTYQGLILTSIINQEVSKPSDQAQVAQVFLSRLSSGSMLQSNVTAYYGALIAGATPSINYPSPYNTYEHSGLPPTPISTISASALYAATHPANTHWAYFVTGDDGTTYFSTTLAQQQYNTETYCHKLCSQ